MKTDAEVRASHFRKHVIPATYHECLSVVLSSLKVKILRHAATHAAAGETENEVSVVTKADLLESVRTVLPTAISELEEALDAVEPDPVCSVS